MRSRSLGVVLLLSGLLFAGCGPKYTYPASQVPTTVERLCREEYKLPVRARVVGKTLGALLSVNDGMDLAKPMSKEINEKMGKVMQVITRVALSTDLPIDFCVVVLRDSTNRTELVIIRSVDDTKRANAEMIGIEESMNRTVFGQNRFSPPPNDEFILKDVKLGDFLADQSVQRIRFSFMKDLKDESLQPLVLADGSYETEDRDRSFQFSIIALKEDKETNALANAFQVISQVLGGYDFRDYRRVEIKDYAARKRLTVPRQAISLYRDKKMSLDEVLDRYSDDFDVTLDAFKLFGINIAEGVSGSHAQNAASPLSTE